MRAVERDGTKLFEITDAGREHVAAAHGQTGAVGDGGRPGVRGAGRASLARAQIEWPPDRWSRPATRSRSSRARDTLADTRRRLYRILAEDDDTEATSREPDA